MNSLDYSLQSPQDRVSLVSNLLSTSPPESLTPFYLEKLATYIIRPTKEQKSITTPNHQITINKRECALSGEDEIYGLIAEDKNIIFSPKTSITPEDVATVPGLKTLKEEITKLESLIAVSSGRKRFLLKKQLIQMRQDQYVLKSMYKKPIYSVNLIRSLPRLSLDEEVNLDEEGNPSSTGIINLYSPSHILLLLSNYSRLKQDSWADLSSDLHWLLIDLEDLIDRYIKPAYPKYFDIIVDKIDGLQAVDIVQHLYEKYGQKHTPEYLSSLWRKKIPELIAKAAGDDWLDFHYLSEEKGQWKKCSRCGQIKLIHHRYFSKNRSSHDGFYSICKDCRNKRRKENTNGTTCQDNTTKSS